MAPTGSDEVLLFDRFRFDRRAGGLFRVDQSGTAIPVALGSRALELLALLAGRNGNAVSKDEILTIVWSGRAVEEANLNVQISKLRHIIDQGRPCGSCIQTITGYGYRFVAEVTLAPRSAPTSVAGNAIGGLKDALGLPHINAGCENDAGGIDSVLATRRGLPLSQVRDRPRHPIEGICADGNVDAGGGMDRHRSVLSVNLRRRLIEDYGDTAAITMLIDLVIAAYQDFIRVDAWIANASMVVEHELFSFDATDPQPNSGRSAGGVTPAARVQPFGQLRESLIPLAERCGSRLREVLDALEEFCAHRARGRSGREEGRSRGVPSPAPGSDVDLSDEFGSLD